MNGLLIVSIVLLAAWWGYARGLVAIIASILAMVLAYALTWQETPHLAHYLADKGWLPGLLVWPVAGLLLFFAGSILFSVATRWLGSLMPEEWHESGKIPGAISGVLLGAGIGLFAVWVASTLRDAWYLRTAQQASVDHVASDASTIGKIDHLASDLSGQAMAVMVKGALGDSPAAAVAAHWVHQPLSMSEGLRHLSTKPELRLLFQEPANYAVLVNGSSADILRLAPFQALTEDVQVLNFLAIAGLPGKTLPEQSQALADMLSRYARHFEKLRTTPEFQALVQDPELREKLQQGNLLALMTNDKMRQLADMLAQGHLPEPLPAATIPPPHEKQMSEATNTRTPSAKSLYRWKDSNGRLHITEEKPPEGAEADVIRP
ncbi:MAG TPA: CvpA family protein [Pseudomonadales bacterium]|nr:CvpA family protein [Pseudomonadales bacterium]